MALTYKTDQITLNAADTDFTILTAAASTTLVKNITWIHDDHNTSVILSLTKSGGTKTQIGTFSATANVPLKIWTDILPLEANDILHLQSNHIGSADLGYCIISYVEDTTSVAGQSIAVHTDVSITGITDGQVLEWNAAATEFQPATPSSGPADTDALPEGSTNLYYTDARVAANSAVTANTAKVSADGSVTSHNDVTSAGSGAIITSAERTKLSGIATGATANQTDAYLLSRTNHTGTQTAATISDFDTEVSNNTAVVANTAKVSADGSVTTHNDVTSAGSGAIITSAERTKLTGIATGATLNSPDSILLDRAYHTGTQTTSTISDFSTAVDARITSAREQYFFDELTTDRNITMGTDVSGSNGLIFDILNDTVATRTSATAKNMLGYHLSNGDCVLRGMIDLGSAITASVGQPLWLGASGAFSASAPTTATEYSRIVGYYVGIGAGGEVMVYFNPSPDWVQID